MRYGVGREAVDPASGGVWVEVAAGYDEGGLGAIQFYLYAVALAQTDIGGLTGGEDELAGEGAVFDFGNYFADAQGVLVILMLYAGWQPCGDAVDVVLGERGSHFVFGEHFDFPYARA